MTYEVAIVGASGYTGGELLRVLAVHPDVNVKVVTSREYANKPVYYAHPHLRGIYPASLKFKRLDDPDQLSDVVGDVDLVFLALPHKVSLHYVPKALEVGYKVVDLSADYRLKRVEDYKTWYGYEHPYPDLLEKAVYGLPELYGDKIRGAQLVANPGCNATSSILAVLPPAAERIIDLDRIVVDVKVGSSEAGAKPYRGGHHPEREGTARPYDAEGHRHVAELEQVIRDYTGRDVKVGFTPHAVSMIRGSLASAYSWLTKDLAPLDVQRIYAKYYAGKKFVKIVRGAPMPYPDVKNVYGSNYAEVGFALDKRVGRLAMFAAIDNLMKGAAGTAVQNMNLMLGMDEDEGLKNLVPVRP
ncbi:N-acetyl-gamma-glutamyl-phosphate reductase [Ignicoccus hospitalis]|uniref:Putative [LysW]-L-2-aminoadipate/[LysW]-L-glutamate phosphate reductase n=1 Tax=Ignicoccus hospitalis (strain KIN4/I / DSM 18386 / JCM 14125) TaxID=453591 RepID=LYSY_IGNH4|nr:N-acetyl-gamma-glutamyl-phosphate reductase [Ignicoccus hospitalis]A8AAF8.1 RecName: Full=Putative [LysW]-L-2-aminoadipate/[LysW]-L-glutamate phosphate reductase [Ignicoccus hospitalis KIN4/I]ABU81910.1 N2-acetyl-L-aminoadipate semialdehyde dehydrogenase [Ignicoccus hospitalis KIN4/I]HIH89932.1 N-acetyl-gamma-glutamyl-phosphate reductase [Desulfurococcaceae archaeon]